MSLGLPNQRDEMDGGGFRARDQEKVDGHKEVSQSLQEVNLGEETQERKGSQGSEDRSQKEGCQHV